MEESDCWLLFKYPLISIEYDANSRIYQGYLRVNNEDIKVRIRYSVNNNQFKIEEPQKFSEGFGGQSFRQKANSIVEYLDRLYSALCAETSKTENLSHVYRKVLHEYCELTNFFLTLRKCELSQDLALIKVHMADDKNRLHYAEISVTFTESNNIFNISLYDLPQKTPGQSFQPNSSLVELFGEYVSAVESLQPYFDFMDVLDQNSYVLDPGKPRKAESYRRIYLDENLSVVITVNPFNIFSRPDIKFLGPDRLVNEYRLKLNSSLEDWKPSSDILGNILQVLGIGAFPMRNNKNGDDRQVLKDVGDCAICFNTHYNDKLPEVVCENKSCENIYHTDCLYEWLISTNYKRMFNDIYGQCPVCEKGIYCKIPASVGN